MKFTCPHCGARSTFRTTRMLSELTKEGYADCRNPDCGHGFRVLSSITHTTRASRQPNEAIARQLQVKVPDVDKSSIPKPAYRW
ncbi:ogr/Delta-like zinc finger family protein [Burkholderia vietnamiensis]|uniref:ogr/Delta-like zinc finger family protein n=1 Tax=Burkholderia vietnamiensis TaxID=60552 RepID=UPI001B93F191|nr:ogr/Delta-like zinc finger family protein [Burkholderia vietnamiensis]